MRAVDLTAATASRYLHHAFTQLLGVVDRVGETHLNTRPHGEGTNSVAALVVHCCGLTEFWLGHVGLGRDSARDRDAELRATATTSELRALVAATVAQADADLADLAGGGSAKPAHDARQFLLGGDESDASLVLHVIEELFQHLGHAELTADALVG